MQAEQFGLFQSASTSISVAAEFYQWRADLWERAGLLALKGEDPTIALEYLGKASSLAALSTDALIASGDAYMEKGDAASAIRYWGMAQDGLGEANLEIIERLLSAHSSQKNYLAMVEDFKRLIPIQPNEAGLYYQLGLLLSATEPESGLPYLEQAAALDPEYTSNTNLIRRNINTARLSGEPAYIFLLAGRALASIDEWDLAVEAFQRATQARPDYSEAWAFLGEARQHLPSKDEQSEQSLEELELALRLDPESLAANSFLALYWQRLGQYELALDYFRIAARLDPTNPTFLLEIGNTLADLGDLPAAQASYQQAIDLAPKDPQNWRALAEFSIRYQIQLHELALPAAQQAYDLDPMDPNSLVVLGNAYYFLEEYDRAQKYLQEAIELNPDFPLAHLHIGLNYLLQGNIQQAAHALQQARQLAPGTSIAEQADRLLLQYFP